MFFLKELPTRRMLEGYRDRFPAMNIDAVQSALDLLRQASLLIRELDAYFASQSFSQLRFLILVVVDREPEGGGLTVSEIASRLDVSKPVLTRTLQTLLDDKLIRVSEHGSDRRAKIVSLTQSGEDKLKVVLPGYYRRIEGFMAERNKPHG